MDWFTLSKDLGIFGIGLGFIAWLIRKLFKTFLDKDIEKYKSDLKIEQMKFSRLHDDRSNTISELYALLADLDTKMNSLTSPLQLAGEPSKEEKEKIAGEAGQKFVEFFYKKKIYFSKSIVKLLDELIKKFNEAWIYSTPYPKTEFDEYESSEIKKERLNFLKMAWKTVSEQIPPIKEKLEDEFRLIYGVEEK